MTHRISLKEIEVKAIVNLKVSLTLADFDD